MPFVYACEGCNFENNPVIEPVEAPLPFVNIHDFEKWLRQRYIQIAYVKNTECLGIFSSEGVFEICCQKFPNTPSTSEFEDFLQGKILSHNHPSSSTLSYSDVLVWANLKMKEFRAVTELWTYSIRPKDAVWPTPELIIGEITKKYPSISLFQFNNNHEMRHDCFQTLAEEGLFEYSETYP